MTNPNCVTFLIMKRFASEETDITAVKGCKRTLADQKEQISQPDSQPRNELEERKTSLLNSKQGATIKM